MGTTVYLEMSMGDRQTVDCEAVEVGSDVVWARPREDDSEGVVPLSNVAAIRGDNAEKGIDETEYHGGRMTELVTYLS